MDSRTELEIQHGELLSFQAKMSNIAGRIPLVRNLMKMIHSKKGRDTLILGAVITVCGMILIWRLFK